MQTGKEKNFDLVSTWGNIFHSANATTRIFGEKPCVMSFLNNNEGYPGLVAALQGPAGPLNCTDFAIQDLFKLTLTDAIAKVDDLLGFASSKKATK